MKTSFLHRSYFRLTLFFLLLLGTLLFTACGSKPSGPREMTLQQFLDEKPDSGEYTMEVQLVSILNPVLGIVEDAAGTQVNLFGVTINGEFKNFEEANLYVGDTLILANGRYNEFEDSIEIADAELVEKR